MEKTGQCTAGVWSIRRVSTFAGQSGAGGITISGLPMQQLCKEQNADKGNIVIQDFV